MFDLNNIDFKIGSMHVDEIDMDADSDNRKNRYGPALKK